MPILSFQKPDKVILLESDPNYGSAYLNRANAKEMLRDQEGACNDWQKAKELGVELGKTYYSSNCSE
jgi:hypothetical protein